MLDGTVRVCRQRRLVGRVSAVRGNAHHALAVLGGERDNRANEQP